MARPSDLLRRHRHALLGAAAVVGLSGYMVDRELSIRRAKAADATAWNISGPACPQITEAQFLSGRKKGPQGFQYEGVGFYRRAGNAECASIYYDGGRSDRYFPVCQFTKPEELLVRTAAGDWYFAPGPRQPATVSAAHGRVRCVMAARKAGAPPQ